MKTKEEIIQIIESKKDDKLFKQKCRENLVCYVCGNDLEYKFEKISFFNTNHYLMCKEDAAHYLELITPERKK
jgi:hypothetical protein